MARCRYSNNTTVTTGGSYDNLLGASLTAHIIRYYLHSDYHAKTTEQHEEDAVNEAVEETIRFRRLKKKV